MKSILLSLCVLGSALPGLSFPKPLTQKLIINEFPISNITNPDSNAIRMAQGLPLIKPTRTWKQNRKDRRQAAASPTVPVTTTSKGYLYAVQNDGTEAGCIISDGSWYVGGKLFYPMFTRLES